MSRADEIFLGNLREIIDGGWSDEGVPVRPHWEDGTARAHKKEILYSKPLRPTGGISRYNGTQDKFR